MKDFNTNTQLLIEVIFDIRFSTIFKGLMED